jgi:predicted ATPase
MTELLVGREDELRGLDGALDQMTSGAAKAVFVAGEPGIGKTHVLHQLVRRG